MSISRNLFLLLVIGGSLATLISIRDLFTNVSSEQLLEFSKLIKDFQLEGYESVIKDSDLEALTAVKMALKLKQMEDKLDKAQQLFQHAIALNPDHDVLLHRKEFLETSKDFINVDHFYLKVIMLRPTNSEALANRERTLPGVNQMDLGLIKKDQH